MEPNSKRKKLWLGILGLLFMALIATAAALVAFELTRSGEVETIDESRSLPRSADPDRPGRLVLDLRGVELTIVKGAPEKTIRVSGSYNSAGYDWTAVYSTEGDAPWVYRLEVQPIGLLHRLAPAPGTALRIELPPNLPLAIDGEISGGSTSAELGSTWTVATTLQVGPGQHRFAFSEPLRQPMTHLHLDVPVGEIEIAQLGNAGPGDVRIDVGTGEACIDLRGEWTVDSRIEIACGVGHCDIHEPGRDDAVIAHDDGPGERSALPRIEIHDTSMLDTVSISEALAD
ncbi:MAG: hypothetical protein GY716_23525 [bacterium]|nr:hypothetical protein [bacterium]